MGSLNKVFLIGYLGQDPDKRVTQGGHSVVTLSVATSEKFKDKQGNKQEKTEWHRVVFWNAQADAIEKYLSKGSQIYIEGSLHTKEYTDKDNIKRWSTEINGMAFQFLDSKGQAQGAPQPGHQGYSENHPGAHGGQAESDYIESDIPF